MPDITSGVFFCHSIIVLGDRVDEFLGGAGVALKPSSTRAASSLGMCRS